MRRGRTNTQILSQNPRQDTPQIKPEKEGRSGSRLKSKLSINSQNFVMCRVGKFDDHYTITGKIGEGSFGTVYKVKHKTLRFERALKTIKRRNNGPFSSFDEIEVLKKLDHSNILKIFQFYEAPESYYIITEIFDGKQLFDVITEQQKLTQRDAANILKEVLRALNYTHSLKIAHRDIKPENILVRKMKEKYKVKIIDWGLGTLMGNAKSNRVCGTPQYCAPQVLKGSHTLTCDMWSVGAIAYVMLTGEMPFAGNNTQETISVVKKGVLNTRNETFKNLSAQARKFITSLMNKNPDKRMSAKDALQHEWIKANASHEGDPVFLNQTLQRLRQIKVSSHLSTAVISYVNNHLSEDSQRQKLQEIFKHLDTNNDGVLSLEQLMEGYSKIYGREVGKQIALQTFSKLDINSSNTLQFSQFVTFGLKQQKEEEESRLREAFDLFDRDKNGKISKEEIALVLRGKIDASMESQLNQIIRDIDENGDQEIDVDQFIKSIDKIPASGENKRQEMKSQTQMKSQKKVNTKSTSKVGKRSSLNEGQTRKTVGSRRLLRSNSKGQI